MDNQTYLNQITASTHIKPAAQNSDSSFISKIIKIAAIGIGVFVILIIFGVILGNLTGSYLDNTKKLDLRTQNLITTIETYNKKVKSSTLRSIGSNLKGVLTSTHTSLSSYLSSEHDYDTSKPSDSLKTSETAFIDSLNNELEYARLNGTLDRAYLNKLMYQIVLLNSLESGILESIGSSNESLKTILTDSQSNLAKIYSDLENCSTD